MTLEAGIAIESTSSSGLQGLDFHIGLRLRGGHRTDSGKDGSLSVYVWKDVLSGSSSQPGGKCEKISIF